MRRNPFLIALVISSLPAAAQTAQVAAPPAPISTIQTTTQLVVVDVVVEDRAGHPVHGLKAADFQLTEGKAGQTVKTFEEHTAADLSAAKLPPPLKLPAGMFTNYTPVPENSALNVLLLDTLNTPMADQAYVRNQLQQYVKHANPGTRIAIFGLTSHLILLQGFSSDPEILKHVVEHKLIPRASVLLDDPVGSGASSASLSDQMSDLGASASAVAGMQQFEAENATFQVQLRTRYTLDAFNQLSRYLSAFPGRKNVLWFSGAFPLGIFADPSLNDPFAAQADFSDELHETTSLLDRARVAVYPIDARGLQTNPVFNASQSGQGFARNPGKFAAAIASFNQQTAQEHMTMDTIAADTGGHAFYNTNGLAEAVTKALDAGSNYYTLTYAPTNHKWDGGYRTIKVALGGEPGTRGLKLAYRSGYYADDPNSTKTSASSAVLSAPAGGAAPAQAPPAAVSYARAAMLRGAPTPSEILIKARVLPDHAGMDETIFEHNQPNPNLKQKGPFRLYDVDLVAVPQDIRLKLLADNRRHGTVEFIVFVYDSDGRLLNSEGSTLSMDLLPASYARVMKAGVGFRLQVSAPAKGESFLRIGVHDLTSGHFGVIEVPTSSVSALPPPSPQTAHTVAAPAAPDAPVAPPPAAPATGAPAPGPGC